MGGRPTSRSAVNPKTLLTFLLTFLTFLRPALSKPYITSFSMDMHYGLMTVQFSEEMMSKFFDATKITLQNVQSYYNCTGSQVAPSCPVSTGALRVPISSNAYSSVYNATSLYVSIVGADYAVLSMAATIATSVDNTYIIVDENVTRSSGDLSVSKAVVDGAALKASTFTADALKPAFSSYTLDMDSGYMSMTFGEPVNASSFLASGITFQATDNIGTNPDANTITLSNTNVTVLSSDGLTINVDLGLKNLNDIKALSPLGINTEKTYLSISTPAIKDIAGNDMSLAYLSIYEGKQPTSFTPDTTTPTLQWYDLDMDSGTLTLHFSETINSFQFDVTDIFLQENVLRVSGSSYQLSSASTKATTTPVPVLTIALAAADMHGIKLLDMAVASEDSKTYMTFNSSLTKDTSELELAIEPLVNGVSSRNVVTFTPDTTAPTVVSYILDMNARTLYLTFDEPVRANTLLVTYLNIQDTYDVATNQGNAVALTSGSSTSSPNDLVIVVDLCEKDFNAIKMQPNMAISQATTFLTYSNFAGDNFIKDMIIPANIVTQVVDGFGKLPASFVADQAKPTLRYYSMDMDSGELIMTFSEPIDASSLNVSKIVLQDQSEKVICNVYGLCSVPGKSASSSYRLKESSSSVVDADNTTVTVNVGVDDRNMVKVVEGFYTSLSNTFLACDDSMVFDIADYLDGSLAQNGVNAITVTAALAGSAFTVDTTSPYLSTFTLDMDSGILSITFDEPVRASSFNATGAVMWNSRFMSANATKVQLSKESFTASDNGLVLDVAIAYDDLNLLKLATDGFNDVTKTFLQTESRMVDDMADVGNAIAMASGTAPQALVVTPDSTFPTLLSFDFDPTNGNLTFHFDEVVDTSSFDAAGITIQDQAFATASFRLTDVAAIQVDGTSISAYLGSIDKTAQSSAGANIGTSAENTYVTIINAAIADVAVSPNQVKAITDGAGLKLGPALFKFRLDMNEGTLTFRFSEPVDPETIDPTLITVQDAVTATKSYTLTGHVDKSYKHNNYTVSISLNPTDMDQIKSTSGLLYSLGTSYVRMAAGAIYDYTTGSWIGPNKLLAVGDGNALQAEAMIYDTTRPNLLSFTLDMDVGTLTLNFDEPVLASSFNAAKVTLSGEKDSTLATADTFTLTSLSATSSVDGSSLVVTLERSGGLYQDFDLIAYARQMATTKRDTFLVLSEDTVVDTSPKFNKVNAIAATNATKCAFFTPDSTSPTLLSYSLDMNEGSMILTFSEAVWVDNTFDVRAIQLQDAATNTFTESYVLTTDTKISNETYTKAALRKIPAIAEVKLKLGESDIDEIKSKRTLANNLATTFISVAETLTKDIAQANNTLVAIVDTSAKAPTAYTADSTSPNLVSYTIDMNAGTMNFIFDEIVDPSSLNPSQINLQYGPFAGASANQYSLTSSVISTASTVGSRTFGVVFSVDDLNELKLKLELVTGVADTYLRFPPEFVRDMAGNAITIIRDGRAQQVSGFTADTTRPSITSFQLKTNGKIILKFSEAVSTTSLNVTAITLQNVDSSLKYPLTAYTLLTGDALLSTKLTLTLGQDFIDAQLMGIATSQLTSYMSSSAYAITDIAGNRVHAIAKNDAVLMGPALERFNLDMDKRKMDFYFSESVKGNFSAEALTLFDSVSGSNSVTLTGWNFTADPTPSPGEKPYLQANSSDHVTAWLSAADITAIKSNGHIGTLRSNTFLSISSVLPFTFNEDTQSVGSPLQIVPIIPSKAMQVTTFTPDAVNPSLTGYDIDKDSGVLTLRFNEPVELKTFNQSGLVIQQQSERGTGTKFVNLGSDSIVTRTDHLGFVGGDTVVVTLGTSDLGKVLSLDLGAYLTMTSSTARDMAGANNPVVAIPDGSAIAATTIVPDSTGPSVVSFGLDLQLGVLTITFSEPIDGDTFDPTKFSIQGANKKNVTGVYNLTTASVITSNVGETIEVDMNIFRTDLDGIKAKILDGVAKHRNATFLALRDGAFQDYNNNAGQGILHADAIMASSYGYDRVPPTLRSYDLEINSANSADPKYGKLTLHFSEPVDPTSIILANLKLTDTDSSPYGQELNLGSSSVSVSSASSSVDVTLSAGELSSLQSGAIGTGGVSFFSISAGSARDMSGNVLSAINHQMIGPVLEYTTFSMRDNAEKISMIFSEDVKTSSFDPSGLTLVSSNDGTGESYQLTANTTLTPATAAQAVTKVIEIRIGEKDVQNLKKFAGLAVSKETTKVQLSGSLITDTAATPNPAVIITAANAPNVNSFTPDATEPFILRTSLDLSNDILTFEFNEPILASSVKMYQITFQSKSILSASGTDKYTLQDSVYGGENNATISLTLGFNDMSAIKSIANLCSFDKAEDCFYSFLADTFQDTALSPNSVPLVSSGAGLAVSVVYNDTKMPSLNSFDMDLDADTLTLNFDEPVLASSFIPHKLSMQRAMTNVGTQLVVLPGTTTTSSSDGSSIVLDLPVITIETLMLDTSIATDRVTSFLLAELGSFTDARGNNLTAIINGYAMPASNFVFDTTPPTIVSFALDMNLGKATIGFQEYVRVQEVTMKGLTVQKSTTDNPVEHTLMLGTALEQTVNNSKSIVLVFSEPELNTIKDYDGLCNDRNSSFLKMSGSAVLDMGQNGNANMENSDAFMATSFVPDTTPPKLAEYDLDLDSGLMTLRFDETVNEATFIQSGVKLHNMAAKKFSSVHDLVAPSIIKGGGSASNILYVTLSSEDLASIKDKGIGTERNSTWLSMSKGAIKDKANLDVVAVLESGIVGGASMRVSSLILDATEPGLVKFRIDQVGKQALLWFTEPVKIIDLEKFRFSNSSGGELNFLNATFVYKEDNTQVIFDMNTEWNNTNMGNNVTKQESFWQRMEYLGVGGSGAIRLTIASGAVLDMSPGSNMNKDILLRNENFPTCTCGGGLFVSVPCNTVDDAVCKPCTDCGTLANAYQSAACQPTVNTVCSVCTPCQHGYYPSTACGGLSDNVCAVCTTCTDYEYETSPCESGTNRICASCRVCTWLNAKQEMFCNSRSKSWQQENCCFDKEGNQIKCAKADYANLEIEARNGRHHWVFPDTTPHIEGYALGETW
ncbi:hypothetical protein TrST_g6209 [Triparma strigata]|uniref:TNFR-Cys domain-containing protein n=1 Tax=Triparma strigata TaxID=1606541 RepID=A0A9W7BLE7_9STRA|nr:hypothetical protein TrST_g6209 [Triparma strigata]